MPRKKSKKQVKRTIDELVYKGLLTDRRVKLVLSDGTFVRVLDYGIEEKTMDYILMLSDGTNRNFNNTKFHNFEVPVSFNIITANKDRQFK